MEVRTSNEAENIEFCELLENLDIVVNYTHTQRIGNQPKYKKRREYLSMNNRVYCTTSNFGGEFDLDRLTKKFKTNKSLEYCYKNGNELNREKIEINKNYMVAQYEI